MFSQLSDNLQSVFKKLRGQGKISEKNITDAMREVRMALLEADADFKVVKEFINNVREKSLGQEVMKSITPGQQIVKVFHDELTSLLGGDASELDLQAPSHILMVGLNGAGKTTTSAKLALWLKKQRRSPFLVACDLYRPAAIDQLATLAKEINVPVFTPERGEANLIKVAKDALAWGGKQGAQIMIFDTAGRQEVDEELVKELAKLRDFLKPKEVLLVADAATGQQAVSVAMHFDQAVSLTGIVLTKLDGDARGGAALSMRHVTQKPIKFIGSGEKMDMLEAFHPERMANRILGMGDVVSLVERAAEVMDESEALRMAEKLQKSNFDFNDFLAQMKMLKKLGPLEGILGMLPGMGKIKEMGGVDTSRIKRVEAIILSMTAEERKRPEILNGRRRMRIANGSGTKVAEINNLLRQFTQMRKMMKNKGMMNRMMASLGGGKLPKGMGF